MEGLAREVGAKGELERAALVEVLACGVPTYQPWKQIQ